MKIIAFVPMYNSIGRSDVTGAFMPEAVGFLDTHNLDVDHIFRFDNKRSKAHRRRQVIAVLERHHGLSGVAFFCHGYRRGIQAGFTNQTVNDLARAIARATDICDPVVPLYCCSTGAPWKRTLPGGDGGFADRLRDALCQAGADHCRVDAHTTVGHATRNPYVRRFEGLGSALGGAGGAYLIEPRSSLWIRWKNRLRQTDIRFRFPFLDRPEILDELQTV